jgi:hypothetical protein
VVIIMLNLCTNLSDTGQMSMMIFCGQTFVPFSVFCVTVSGLYKLTPITTTCPGVILCIVCAAVVFFL